METRCVFINNIPLLWRIKTWKLRLLNIRYSELDTEKLAFVGHPQWRITNTSTLLQEISSDEAKVKQRCDSILPAFITIRYSYPNSKYIRLFFKPLLSRVASKSEIISQTLLGNCSCYIYIWLLLNVNILPCQ